MPLGIRQWQQMQPQIHCDGGWAGLWTIRRGGGKQPLRARKQRQLGLGVAGSWADSLVGRAVLLLNANRFTERLRETGPL